MKKSIVKLQCPTRDYYLLAFEIDPAGTDRDFVNAVLDEAREHRATPSAPSGRRRNSEKLVKTRYLGVLSERLLIKHFQDELGQNFRVFNKAFVSYGDHVDIEIEVEGRITSLEVRSSFLYAPLWNIVCKLHDIIGPYSTSYKSGESPKDFYLRGFINESVEKFTPGRQHKLYFAGGASYQQIIKNGRQDDFKQQKASYWILRMPKAKDAREIVEEIRRYASGV